MKGFWKTDGHMEGDSLLKGMEGGREIWPEEEKGGEGNGV